MPFSLKIQININSMLYKNTINRFLKNKILLFLFLCPLLHAEFIDEIILKKDEVKTIDFIVENTKKTLSFRWTLYKDRGLVMHLNYDRNPHQCVLYKENLNSYKITLSNINTSNNPNPYFIIYFIDFDDAKKEAKFRYYFFDFNKNIEII